MFDWVWHCVIRLANFLSQKLSSIQSLHGLQEGPYEIYTSSTWPYCGHFQIPHTHPKAQGRPIYVNIIVSYSNSHNTSNTSKGTHTGIHPDLNGDLIWRDWSSPGDSLADLNFGVHKYTMTFRRKASRYEVYESTSLDTALSFETRVVMASRFSDLGKWRSWCGDFSDMGRSLRMDRAASAHLSLRLGSPFNGKLWRRGSALIVSCDVACRQTCLEDGMRHIWHLVSDQPHSGESFTWSWHLRAQHYDPRKRAFRFHCFLFNGREGRPIQWTNFRYNSEVSSEGKWGGNNVWNM